MLLLLLLQRQGGGGNLLAMKNKKHWPARRLITHANMAIQAYWRKCVNAGAAVWRGAGGSWGGEQGRYVCMPGGLSGRRDSCETSQVGKGNSDEGGGGGPPQGVAGVEAWERPAMRGHSSGEGGGRRCWARLQVGREEHRTLACCKRQLYADRLALLQTPCFA